jgi:hypothetical protein
MVIATDSHDEELAMTWLTMNIPLMVLFFALWAGIPMWLVLRRPDAGPESSATASVSNLPAAPSDDAGHRRAA